MVGGIAGGCSTHGICLGALSWRVDAGEKDGVDLAERRVGRGASSTPTS